MVLLQGRKGHQSPAANAFSTIKYLYEAGAKVVLVGWRETINSRFSSEPCPSVESVAEFLSSVLELQVVPVKYVSIGGGNLADKVAALHSLTSTCDGLIFVGSWQPVDIGPRSLQEMIYVVSKCKDKGGTLELAETLGNLSSCDITFVGKIECKELLGKSKPFSNDNFVKTAAVVWEVLKGRKLPGLLALDRAYPYQVDWSVTYGDPTRPLVVDVGSGNGLFLVGMARRRKDMNFLGLEMNAKVFLQSDIEAVALRMKNEFLNGQHGEIEEEKVKNIHRTCGDMMDNCSGSGHSSETATLDFGGLTDEIYIGSTSDDDYISDSLGGLNCLVANILWAG
ncbi:UNVERIFIED_CONTAM: hypothetical protein Sradi_5910300 [Sesamum radiatum]|uniref:tRNA (guanine(46)-N(7))-methyltransferase n=1 Tax=Sesamum radiatum TaxID=300843 RepID=A0AAW2KRS8_SESRA